MKNFVTQFIILITTVIIFCITHTNAQWVHTNGPYGGPDINCLAINGPCIFVGTHGDGVFRSTNNGINWENVSIGLTEKIVTSLSIKDSNIFAGTYGGIFLSTNNGATWSKIGPEITNTIIEAIAVKDSNIFAGSYYGEVYISSNNGKSWSNFSKGLPGPNLMQLSANDSMIFAGTSHGIYISTNNGADWTCTFNGNNVRALAVNGTKIIASVNGYGGGVLSIDNGKNWTSIKSNTFFSDVIAITMSGSRIVAGTTQGTVYLSTNDGISWTLISHGLPLKEIHAIAISDSNIFIGMEERGVFLTTDKGKNWITLGCTKSSIDCIGIKELNVFAGSVFLSTNNGESWNSVCEGLPQLGPVNTFAIKDSFIFAGTGGYGIFLSKNNGINWTAANEGLTSRSVRLIVTNGSSIFAATDINAQGVGGVYLSSNNGISWTKLISPLIQEVSVIESIILTNSNIIIGTNRGILLYTNNGTSWVLTDSALIDKSIHSLVSVGLMIFAVTQPNNHSPVGVYDGVYISMDNGTNWATRNEGLPTNSGTFNINTLIAYEGNLFLGTSKDVYLSTDNGKNWIPTNLLSDNMYTISLAVNKNYIFAGTNNGVWKRPLSELVTYIKKEEYNNLPRSFSLSQNYPNPFNPMTIIKYQIPSSGLVQLKVYDILGREVITLVNENKSPGNYEVTFKGNNLSSGVYFYRIHVGSFTDTKKLILLK